MGCWLTTPTMLPPAAASRRLDMADAAGSQPTSSHLPLVEVLVTRTVLIVTPPSPWPEGSARRRPARLTSGWSRFPISGLPSSFASWAHRPSGSTAATSSPVPNGATSLCTAAGSIRVPIACMGYPRRSGCATPSATPRSSHNRLAVTGRIGARAAAAVSAGHGGIPGRLPTGLCADHGRTALPRPPVSAAGGDHGRPAGRGRPPSPVQRRPRPAPAGGHLLAHLN